MSKMSYSLSSLVAITFALCLAAGNTINSNVVAAAFDYADALDKALLFFEAQRSGKLPPGQRAAWRGDSGLSDGAAARVDLVGGYYDAGDNVKFGLPMAFTVTMLSWSVLEFLGGAPTTPTPRQYLQEDNARAAVRWGADYLLKAATATDDDALYVQVGDPYRDHACWQRPEDVDAPSRSVYRVDRDHPGSDVAGETAAALAAASLVFRVCDPPYSARLLRAARKVFGFADRYRGSYTDSLSSVACPFYCSYSGYQDELLWAAAWLHLATTTQPAASGDGAYYLSYIRSNGHALGADQDDFSFSWDDKRAGTKVLLANAFLLTQGKEKNYSQFQSQLLLPYKAHADAFVCSLVTSQSQFTPGGLLFKSGDSNMQYVTSTAFLLLAYAKHLLLAPSSSSPTSCGVPPSRLIAIAKRQVDYILGANPAATSYMVGFGPRFPRHVHHRAASMPSVRDHPARIACDEGFAYLHSPDPDRNVLIGAVVGGPNAGDRYTDTRDNYAQAEPATYTNAPLVGALAYFAATAQHR